MAMLQTLLDDSGEQDGMPLDLVAVLALPLPLEVKSFLSTLVGSRTAVISSIVFWCQDV